MLLFPDGRLAAEEDFCSEELGITLQQARGSLIGKIRVADSFFRDVRPENDQVAPNALNALLHSPEATAHLKVNASLILLLYYLAQNDLESARALYKQILSHGGYKYSHSTITIVENEMPHMLELMNSSGKGP